MNMMHNSHRSDGTVFWLNDGIRLINNDAQVMIKIKNMEIIIDGVYSVELRREIE